jgi:hypothetical protein
MEEFPTNVGPEFRSTHRGQIASSIGKGIPAESEQLIMVLL